MSDGLVVMHVDHGIDVGAQAQDLPIELVADAGLDAAVEQPPARYVGDHHMLELHLLE